MWGFQPMQLAPCSHLLKLTPDISWLPWAEDSAGWARPFSPPLCEARPRVQRGFSSCVCRLGSSCVGKPRSVSLCGSSMSPRGFEKCCKGGIKWRSSLLSIWLAEGGCVPQIEEMELVCLGLLLSSGQAWMMVPPSSADGCKLRTFTVNISVGGLDWIPVDSQPQSGLLGPSPWGRWAHSEGPQTAPFLWPSSPEDAGVGMSLHHGLCWLGTTHIFRGSGGEEGQICTLPFMKLVSHNFMHACSRKCLWC